MTLHKTDHLSKKDIQKRKSTLSHFELQNFFFHTHFKLMMSDVFFNILTYYITKNFQNIHSYVGGIF